MINRLLHICTYYMHQASQRQNIIRQYIIILILLNKISCWKCLFNICMCVCLKMTESLMNVINIWNSYLRILPIILLLFENVCIHRFIAFLQYIWIVIKSVCTALYLVCLINMCGLINVVGKIGFFRHVHTS